MFTREYLLGSAWYRKRLETKQRRDVALWTRHVAALDAHLADPAYAETSVSMGLAGRRQMAAGELKRVSSPEYLQALVGTLGADPMGE